MVSVGGFFASLKLVTDENSFQKGIGVLGKFPGLLKAGVAGAVGLGAAMVGLATSTATAMAKLDAQARTLGMSARTLDNWRGAVGLAGGDADSFVESMMNMNEAFQNLKIGEVKQDFLTATGMSGANFAAMQGMSNDQRLRTIWSALEKVGDKDKQQALIEKIFGASGVQLFSLLQAKGQTLAGNYAQAANINPMTEADYRSAVEGDKKQREITQSLEKNFQNLGLKIEQALLPSLDKLAKWMTEHQKELDDFAKAVGDATSWLIKFVTSFGEKGGVEKVMAKTFLGGEAQFKAFEALKKSRGVESGSAAETMLFLGPEWSALSKAMADNNIYNELTDELKKKNSKGTSAFSSYTSALEKSGLDIAQRYFAASNLAQNLQGKPQVNISVSVDKEGNVTVKNKDSGEVLQSVRGGIAYGQNGSILK